MTMRRDVPKKDMLSSGSDSESETAPAATPKSKAAPKVEAAPASPPSSSEEDDCGSVDSLEFTHGKGKGKGKVRRGGRQASAAPDGAGTCEVRDRTPPPPPPPLRLHEAPEAARGRTAFRAREPVSRHHPSDGYKGSPHKDQKGGSPHKGGKGKSKSKAVTRCPDCYKPLGAWGASWDQHRYWNENCLAWQAYNRGDGKVSWNAACDAAAETKRHRMALHQQEMAAEAGLEAEAGLPTESRPPCAVEEVILEEPTRATRTKKEKKDRKKDKKEKKEKKKRPPRASPSPDPVLKGGPKKRPPDDDASESDHHGRHSKAAVRQLLSAMIKCL